MLPNRTPLVGFEGIKIMPKGSIILEVQAAERTLDVDFVVADAPSSYNSIMVRGWIHWMEGVVSTLHQVMRCLTQDSKSMIDIRGDQLMAQTCYNLAMETREEPKKE